MIDHLHHAQVHFVRKHLIEEINVKTAGKIIMNDTESILRLTLTEHQANMHMQMCIRSIIASTMWVIFNVRRTKRTKARTSWDVGTLRSMKIIAKVALS